MTRKLPLSLVLVAAALAGVACGGGKTLDTANVERDIQQIASEGGIETEVECPSEVEDVEEGTTYDCTITYAGNENNQQNVLMRVGEDDESEFVDQQAVQDQGLIRQIVAQTDDDPALVCEYLSEELREQTGGDDCAATAAREDDGRPTVIRSIRVEGDTATMETDRSTTTWERDEEGSWVATAVE